MTAGERELAIRLRRVSGRRVERHAVGVEVQELRHATRALAGERLLAGFLPGAGRRARRSMTTAYVPRSASRWRFIADITRETAAAITQAAAMIEGPVLLTGHSAGGHLAACMVATDWKALDASAPADLSASLP